MTASRMGGGGDLHRTVGWVHNTPGFDHPGDLNEGLYSDWTPPTVSTDTSVEKLVILDAGLATEGFDETWYATPEMLATAKAVSTTATNYVVRDGLGRVLEQTVVKDEGGQTRIDSTTNTPAATDLNLFDPALDWIRTVQLASTVSTVTSSWDPEGKTTETEFEYDPATGKVSAVITDPHHTSLAGWSRTETDYGDDVLNNIGLPVEVARVSEDGNTVRAVTTVYNHHRPVIQTAPGGGLQVTRYNAATGAVDATVGPDGVAQVVRVSDPFGVASVTQVVNVLTGDSLPETTTSATIAPNPVTDAWAYMIRTEQPGSGWAEQEYSATGQLVRTRVPRANGEPRSADIAEQTFSYDARGNAIATSDWFWQGDTDYASTATQYDLLNRPVSSTDLDGDVTSYTYPDPYQTLMTAAGRTTRTLRDPGGRWVDQFAPDGTVTRTSYNAEGATVSITPNATGLPSRNPNIPAIRPAYTFTFDDYGMTGAIDPDRGTLAIVDVSEFGEILQSTSTAPDGSDTRTTTFDFDEATGLLNGTTITSTDPKATTWSTESIWNPATGQLLSATSSDGIETRTELDALNRPIGEWTIYPDGAAFHNVTGYNGLGQLTSRKYPTWARIGLTAAKPLSTTIDNDPVYGWLRSVSDASGGKYEYFYFGTENAAGQSTSNLFDNRQLTDITNYNADHQTWVRHLTVNQGAPNAETTLYHETFEYGADGRLELRTRDDDTDYTMAYTYDTNGQLDTYTITDAADAQAVYGMKYDRFGNILTREVTGQPTLGLTYNAKQQVTRTANGGVTGDRFTYNARGQLERVTHTGEPTVQITNGLLDMFTAFTVGTKRTTVLRDANGVKRAETSPTTIRYYPGGGAQIERNRATGVITERIVVAGTTVVRTIQPTTGKISTDRRFTAVDQQGTALVAVNTATNSITDRKLYTPWATPLDPEAPASGTAPAPNQIDTVFNQSHAGHEAPLGGSDWVDYGYRLYNPEIARFDRPDPVIAETIAFNPYTYVRNDSPNLTDPDGRAPAPVCEDRFVGEDFNPCGDNGTSSGTDAAVVVPLDLTAPAAIGEPGQCVPGQSCMVIEVVEDTSAVEFIPAPDSEADGYYEGCDPAASAACMFKINGRSPDEAEMAEWEARSRAIRGERIMADDQGVIDKVRAKREAWYRQKKAHQASNDASLQFAVRGTLAVLFCVVFCEGMIAGGVVSSAASGAAGGTSVAGGGAVTAGAGSGGVITATEAVLMTTGAAAVVAADGPPPLPGESVSEAPPIVANGTFSVAYTNKNGGKIMVSEGVISQVQVADIVDPALERGERVTIISGLHGGSAGNMVEGADLLQEDFDRWLAHPNAEVWDGDSIKTTDLFRIVDTEPGTIVFAFCHSGACLATYGMIFP